LFEGNASLTTDFTQQQYYKQAMHLSTHPKKYIYEKANPIYRFVPHNDVIKLRAKER